MRSSSGPKRLGFVTLGPDGALIVARVKRRPTSRHRRSTSSTPSAPATPSIATLLTHDLTDPTAAAAAAVTAASAACTIAGAG